MYFSLENVLVGEYLRRRSLKRFDSVVSVSKQTFRETRLQLPEIKAPRPAQLPTTRAPAVICRQTKWPEREAHN